MLSGEQPPLFAVVLRHVKTGELAGMTAGVGWKDFALIERDSGLDLDWKRPEGERWPELHVEARVRSQPRSSAVHWSLRVDSRDREWSLWRVAFPQIEVREWSAESVIFVNKPPEYVNVATRPAASFTDAAVLSALYVYVRPTPLRSVCARRKPPEVNVMITPDPFSFSFHVPSPFFVNVASRPEGAVHVDPDPVNAARNPDGPRKTTFDAATSRPTSCPPAIDQPAPNAPTRLDRPL